MEPTSLPLFRKNHSYSTPPYDLKRKNEITSLLHKFRYFVIQSLAIPLQPVRHASKSQSVGEYGTARCEG